MSDDEEPRRPDETSEFSALDDEGGSRPNGGPRTGDDGEDRTGEMPSEVPDDETRESPMMPPADATSELPPAADPGARTQRYDRVTDTWADGGGPAWSGRAGVRPRDHDDDADWASVPSGEPLGKWWMPIVVGIVGLLLLGVLGWGIYLIVQSTGDSVTPPAVTPSAAPAATTEPTTEAPATTPATTEPVPTEPTPSPPPPPPRDVTVPALKGLSTDEARAALSRKRLSLRLRYVTSDSPPGTVIDSDPAEGQQVPADTIITLIIAAPPSTPATPTQAPTTTAATDQQDED